MEPSLLAWTAQRIAEHSLAHGLDSVRIILHGGEPLLTGHSYLAGAVRSLRATLRVIPRVHIGVQTNAVLLDEDFLRLFRSLGVHVGVSLDGDAAAHDRHRHQVDGRGSHASVSRALRLLMRPENQQVYGGLLCTIDICNDPITTYEAVLGFDPPAVDFLLPHGTWSTPPPGRDRDSTHTPYAEWLIAVFDRWYTAPRRETRVRLFEEIIHLLLGGASHIEAVGLTPTSLVVVETDGNIEQADTLKSTYHGAPTTGLHVERDPFDAALRIPSIAARQLGYQALSEECAGCRLRQVCGAGLYPHRYRAGSGFRNPSVYCPDLFRLIDYIRKRVTADLRAQPGAGR